MQKYVRVCVCGGVSHARCRAAQVQKFRIRWKGYKARDDTWEPKENILTPNALEEYWEHKVRVTVGGQPRGLSVEYDRSDVCACVCLCVL